MQLIYYKEEKKYLGKYFELIRDVYDKYPTFAQARIREAKRVFNKNNPFRQFGSWQNFLLLDNTKPLSHISTIIDNRLPSDIGLIGYFDSINKIEYAKKIFDVAAKFLAKNQKKVVRGPINLTTWQGFRISYPETNPPFFLEPFTRGYYRNLFEGYGFKLAQGNISTIQSLKQTNFDEFEKEFKNLKKDGFIFKTIDSRNFLSSLAEIYDLALASFENTWSFVKISLQEFIYYFGNFSKLINKHFLYIVSDQNKKNVAFFWGMPDLYTKSERRVVLKSMGVLPEYQRLGIARALFYLVYSKAKKENITKFIFSTMRKDNVGIRELTARALDIYREYIVYELTL